MGQTSKKHATVRAFTWDSWTVVHGVKKELPGDDYSGYRMWCGKVADFPAAHTGVSEKRRQSITCKICRLVMRIP